MTKPKKKKQEVSIKDLMKHLRQIETLSHEEEFFFYDRKMLKMTFFVPLELYKQLYKHLK